MSKRYYQTKSIVACLIYMLLVSCGVDVPKEVAPKGCKARTIPDYDGVTLPCNIAPTNFYIEEESETLLSTVEQPWNVSFLQ